MIFKIVLVRSEYASNIGMAARAAANMGATEMILVDPKCRLGVKARQGAAGAQELLKNHKSYKSWELFYQKESDGIRIAFSRRAGKNRKVFGFEEVLKKIKSLKKKKSDILYLIFGPEDNGLDAEDLAYVHYTCSLPIFGEFGSLNLAQAVLLASYITRQKFPPSVMPAQLKAENEVIYKDYYFPDDAIKEWLTAMGFNISSRKSSAYLTLRKLFLMNHPTKHEYQVLEAILQQNIRKLKSLKS